jgi:hypothetical protein
MAMRVEVPLSAINTEIELPITIGVGEVISTVGTLTLQVRGGHVEDFRPALADALREAAATVERATTDEDDEEVSDAPAHG